MSGSELRSFPLLKELDTEQLDLLDGWLEAAEFPAGSCIFEEGRPAAGLVLIASGSVLLESLRCDRTVRVKSRSALGGASLFASGLREASAIAETDCELLQLSETAFQNLIDEAPLLACRLACAIGCELAASARQSLDALGGDSD